MGSPAFILSFIVVYNYFALSLGPRLMKNRAPFSIRPVILAYNALIAIMSVYFVVTMLQLTYLRGTFAGQKGLPPYSVFCEGTDNSSNGIPFLRHMWLFMLVKVTEMLDTVFFVLLKKDDHITNLHIAHHTIALWTAWFQVNNGVTGQGALFPVLNSAAHAVMYTYYGLSALPSSLRPNLWWKKYVTLILILQVIVLTVHGAIPLLYDCGFPRAIACLMVMETGLFTCLFSCFYYNHHIRLRKDD
ncbi:hypothetical protein HPB48_016643 [Haemaphysalis longicornis]|uniref:Elongation of very long chain fatty acids protein n=1 Tax=Haemaphysalis longicornis TaxID=44386 RepID=A0A9J6FL44_HAELO|nr:hypothetical protein HPB48_016643 [Haemaphysalis longicornis]